MPQFLIEKKLDVGGTVEIGGADAHHITNVLRLKEGDWIVLSDGKGDRYKSSVKEAGKKTVNLLIDEKLPWIKIPDITIAQALIKGSGIENIIQKSVELGVSKIIPFVSARTVSKPRENKTERWNKIASAAAKQCGIPLKPKVEPTMDFAEMIKTTKNYTNKLMFYEGEPKNTLKTYFKNTGTPELRNPGTIIIIGPEGGFAPEEVNFAKDNGFATIKLGPLIMRVETAAISALTLTQYFLGHLS